MAIQAKTASLHFSHTFHSPSPMPASLSLLFGPLRSMSMASKPQRIRKSLELVTCKSNPNDNQQDYLIDAPESVGDGFSFSGGKYSDEPSQSDEWFKKGKMVRAHGVAGSGEKAKDPIFGLTMGVSSQTSADVFRSLRYEEIQIKFAGLIDFEICSVYLILCNRWFCVESGSADKHPVILIHGFPSQAYSYRKVLPVLSKDYHAITFDWLGFGFSDKPQPGYGFDYTLGEYVSSLESLINELAISKVSLVVQLTAKHANLPSTLSIFSNFLLGEIFAQDPLRASDKALTSCGPYKMKEDDAMVYRRPYLTSGSSGFALNAISRAMKKELKTYVEDMQMILTDKNWNVQTTVFWGQRDRWLNYDGVEDFCKDSRHKLVELPMAGHHVQEDRGEELGQLISKVISKRSQI